MTEINKTIWIGFDPREEKAFNVARASLLRRLSQPIPVKTLQLGDLRMRKMYQRPIEHRNGRIIDTLSVRGDYDGSISTEHALARFFVPFLALDGLALFMDGDMLVRTDIAAVFENLDPSKAVHVVKHEHCPNNTTKMDDQVQTSYPRKNWSSFMVWDCSHPTLQLLRNMVNVAPGRDLHAFAWLIDRDIGELDPRWNHLVGWSKTVDPHVVHFTEGTPDMEGYGSCEYADEWRAEIPKEI